MDRKGGLKSCVHFTAYKIQIYGKRGAGKCKYIVSRIQGRPAAEGIFSLFCEGAWPGPRGGKVSTKAQKIGAAIGNA